MLPYNILRGLSGMSLAVASYDFDVTPEYKSLGFAAERFLWLQHNWHYLFGLAVLAVIVLVAIYFWRK